MDNEKTLSEQLSDLIEELEEDKIVEDGVYDLTDIEYIRIPDRMDGNHPDYQACLDFVNKHPEFVHASAYETEFDFLLSSMPLKIDRDKTKIIGSGFNYGSTNIIENAPARILILAEND